MLSYHPVFALPTASEDQPAQSFFGGIPSGLPLQLWPVCQECQVAMTPLIQLVAGEWLPRLPEGSVLLVFKCEGADICSFWEHDGGANQCLIVPETQLQDQAGLPSDVVSGRTRILPRINIIGWQTREDGITANEATAMNEYASFYQLPTARQFLHDFDSKLMTKSGPVPYWTGNGPSSEPKLPRVLLFQLDHWIELSEPEDHVMAYLERYDSMVDYSHGMLSAANFMSDGTAFIFDVTPEEELPTPVLEILR